MWIWIFYYLAGKMGWFEEWTKHIRGGSYDAE
jgi:hypothetical protein